MLHTDAHRKDLGEKCKQTLGIKIQIVSKSENFGKDISKQTPNIKYQKGYKGCQHRKSRFVKLHMTRFHKIVSQ